MKKKYKWDGAAGIRSALNELANGRKRLVITTRSLVEACEESIFPADLYFVAACNRALQNLDAFAMAMKADQYSTAMVLLRVQMDSLLRCFAITQTNDPHQTAFRVGTGKRLNELKDKHGCKLSDNRIVKLAIQQGASEALESLYHETSGYVHMSDYAFKSLLAKTRAMGSGEQYRLHIGSTDPDVPAAEKIKQVKIFGQMTLLLTESSKSWTKCRRQFGSTDALQKKYGPKAWSKE